MFVIVDPKNDYAFKVVFGSERHVRVLIHLLNAILVPCGLRVKSVRILNPLSEIQELDDKKLVLDVKAVDEHGRLYNIEMQMVPAPSFPGRFLYYWSNTYGSQLKEGEQYAQLRPVISICFVDGALFPEREECHLRFKLLETAAHFPFNDHLDLHVFQLRHFSKTVDELETDLDLWLYVLNNGKGLDLDNLPLKLRVAEIEEALEAWAMLTQERIKREIYEAREKARRDADDWRLAVQRAEEKARRAEEDRLLAVQQAEDKARRAEEDRLLAVQQAEDKARRAEEDRLLAVQQAEDKSQQAEEKAQQAAEKAQQAAVQREWLGRIRAYEELLHRTPHSADELVAMSVDELRKLAEDLRGELSQSVGKAS
jgi:predicted transposase/invertase (TIGR01784 family)